MASTIFSRENVRNSDKFVTFMDRTTEYEGTNAFSTERTSRSFRIEAQERGEQSPFNTFEMECVSAWLEYCKCFKWFQADRTIWRFVG